MALSGKYDFKGIKALGTSGIRGAFSLSPYTAWLNSWPALTEFILAFITNWLANKGLVVLNIGAIYVDTEFDQRAFDSSLDKAIEKIRLKSGRDKLTAWEIKEIDNAIIKTARNFIVISKPN